MARHNVHQRKAWHVTITEHTIAGKYEIPASEHVQFEGDRRQAIARAIRDAHTDALVPPWRPYLRASWRHATAAEMVYKPA